MIVIKYFTLGAFYHLCASLWEVSDVKPRMYQWAFDRDTLTKFRNIPELGLEPKPGTDYDYA